MRVGDRWPEPAASIPAPDLAAEENCQRSRGVLRRSERRLQRHLQPVRQVQKRRGRNQQVDKHHAGREQEARYARWWTLRRVPSHALKSSPHRKHPRANRRKCFFLLTKNCVDQKKNCSLCTRNWREPWTRCATQSGDSSSPAPRIHSNCASARPATARCVPSPKLSRTNQSSLSTSETIVHCEFCKPIKIIWLPLVATNN